MENQEKSFTSIIQSQTIKELFIVCRQFVPAWNFLAPKMASHFVRVLVLCKREIVIVIRDILKKILSWRSWRIRCKLVVERWFRFLFLVHLRPLGNNRNNFPNKTNYFFSWELTSIYGNSNCGWKRFQNWTSENFRS